MKTNQQGFTLIELMIAVAIIGILASVALPAFNEYQTSARIAEGVTMTKDAKDLINDAATPLEADNNMDAWNLRLAGAGASSKYVRRVLFTVGDGSGTCATCGELTVTLNELNVGAITAATNTIVYKPYKLTAVAAAGAANGTYQAYGPAVLAGVRGGVEWGCASSTQNVATARGLLGITLGTLPADFAPSECR